jgi:uncharacterized Zn finger protein
VNKKTEVRCPRCGKVEPIKKTIGDEYYDKCPDCGMFID